MGSSFDGTMVTTLAFKGDCAYVSRLSVTGEPMGMVLPDEARGLFTEYGVFSESEEKSLDGLCVAPKCCSPQCPIGSQSWSWLRPARISFMSPLFRDNFFFFFL